MDRRTESEKAKDVGDMQSPSRWPQWPYLPLKRYVDNGHGYKQPQFAYVMEYPYGTVRPVLYHGNLFAADPKNDRQEVFPTFEAIVAAGWEVD